MPKSEEKKRHVKYYRTIKLGKDKYAHVAIVKKAGPRGGHTVMGKIHEKEEHKTKRKRHYKRHVKHDII